MKPISELLRILKSIESFDLSTLKRNTDKHLFELSGVVQNANHEADYVLETIRESSNRIASEAELIKKTITEYKKFIQSEIEKQETNYYVSSEEIYYSSRDDTPEYLLTRKKESSSLKQKEVHDIFFARVSEYNSWQYPAIEIRPAFGQITDLIKGCDPLYLLDTDEVLFQKVKHRWSQTYQRRLRYYTFNETNSELFHNLPDEQFGFAVAVDYLNFKPLNIMERYLRNIFIKLKSGGTFMFTYNNCDQVYGARNVENKFCCYTPGKKVIEIAQNIGYTVTKHFDEFEHVSWLELKKPGELSTIRGGQTLGEILSFSHVTKKEPTTPKLDPNSPGEKWAAKNGSRLLRPK